MYNFHRCLAALYYFVGRQKLLSDFFFLNGFYVCFFPYFLVFSSMLFIIVKEWKFCCIWFCFVACSTCRKLTQFAYSIFSPFVMPRRKKVTLVAEIGGFRSDLSITCKTDGNFGNVSVGVLFSKAAYQ